MSIRTILDYPFFGVGPSTGAENRYLYRYVGGHSSWLDLPAEFGILGAGVYFALLFSLLAPSYVNLRARQRDGTVSVSTLARLIVAVVFVIGGSYNPVAGSGPIMALVFFMALGGMRLSDAHPRYEAAISLRTKQTVVRRTK